MRKAAAQIPEVSLERLRALLDYDPETGWLTWRTRPTSDFPKPGLATVWNGRFAGKRAGTRHPKGYIQISIDGRIYLAHRLAWLHVHGVWPDKTDHENGDRTDNRISKLRSVETAGNQRNLGRNKRNTSGVMGVRYDAALRKWVARITVNYSHKHLGCFTRKSAAIKARRAAEREFGFHRNHGRPRNHDKNSAPASTSTKV